MQIKDEYYYLALRIIFISVSILMIAFILFSDFHEIIFRVPDDASYYLKIAGNFNNGKGFSFDGLHQTNGFQPLWQYILIALTFICRSDPGTTLRIVLILQVVLLFLSGNLLFRFLSDYFTNKIIFANGVILILFVFFQSVNSMETALLIFMISVILYFSGSKKIIEIPNPGNEFIFGILSGLLILTRLDSVFFIFPVILICIFKIFSSDGRRKKILTLFLIFAGSAFVLFPYLIYNYKEFGNIIPVSGYLKSGFPEVKFNEKFKDLLHYRETYFAFTAVIYLIWYFVKYKVSKNDFFCSCLAVMSGGVICLLVYMIFFLNWVIFSWYFITYSLFVSLAVSLPLRYLLSLRIVRTANIIFFFIIIFITFYWGIKIYKFYTTGYKILGSNWNIESYEAAQWTKKNSQPVDLFAMKDAGHFSYFSEREVINLDGLVNNFDYQGVLRDKLLNDYLTDNRVKYIVQHASWNRSEITSGDYDTLSLKYFSHKYSAESDPVVLRKVDEVYRSAPYYDGQYETVFLIWKYEP